MILISCAVQRSSIPPNLKEFLVIELESFPYPIIIILIKYALWINYSIALHHHWFPPPQPSPLLFIIISTTKLAFQLVFRRIQTIVILSLLHLFFQNIKQKFQTHFLNYLISLIPHTLNHSIVDFLKVFSIAFVLNLIQLLYFSRTQSHSHKFH